MLLNLFDTLIYLIQVIPFKYFYNFIHAQTKQRHYYSNVINLSSKKSLNKSSNWWKSSYFLYLCWSDKPIWKAGVIWSILIVHKYLKRNEHVWCHKAIRSDWVWSKNLSGIWHAKILLSVKYFMMKSSQIWIGIN